MSRAGFRERSTYKPLGCCIDEGVFDLTGGSAAEFDHKVDHVMTEPAEEGEAASPPPSPAARWRNGYWDSDHAGLLSVAGAPAV